MQCTRRMGTSRFSQLAKPLTTGSPVARCISTALITLLANISWAEPSAAVTTRPDSEISTSLVQVPVNDLDGLLELGLNKSSFALPERAEATARAAAILAETTAPLVLQRSMLGVAQAYIQYETGNAAKALASIGTVQPLISLTDHPTIYVRARALYAGLLLETGKAKEGLALLTALFEQDLTKADELHTEFARTNYALALMRNGQSVKAMQLYRDSTQLGLEKGWDRLAINAGVNLIVHLTKQNLAGESRYWLQKLEPAIERRPHLLGSASLQLHRIDVMVNDGDHQTVARKLREFLASDHQHKGFFEGSVYTALAAAEREIGEFDSAVANARTGLQLQQVKSLDTTEAQIVLALALLSDQQVTEASSVLDNISEGDIIDWSDIRFLREVRLRVSLAKEGLTIADHQLTAMLEAADETERVLRNNQFNYYEALNEVERHRAELAVVNEQRMALAAQSSTNEARANELEARERANQIQRNLLLSMVVLTAFGLIALTYLNGNRRAEQNLRRQEQKQKEALSQLVDQKSAELVDNVTRQSRLEQALMNRRHMEAIGHMTGNLAHDFNNLLQVIAGVNDMLRDAVSTTEDSEELLALVEASDTSLATGSATIKQLLAYSRRQQLEATTIEVGQYFTETTALLRSAAGDANSLIVNDHTDGASVFLDSSQLTGALLNLLRNSVDATAAPGKLIIESRIITLIDTEGELPAGNYIGISVIDSGTGMTAEQLSHALEPYFTTKGNTSGTGLGLSSVCGFVRQSGGDIRIHSTEGEGTTVTLIFPLASEVAPSVATDGGVATSIEGANFLVVEDNPQVGAALKRLLRHMGATSKLVMTADEALQLIVTGDEFDFVLADIQLPGQANGIELSRRIGMAFPNLRVLLMSGMRPESRTAEEQPVLTKPFNRRGLLDFVAAKDRRDKHSRGRRSA